jgi:hypothetical protein
VFIIEATDLILGSLAIENPNWHRTFGGDENGAKVTAAFAHPQTLASGDQSSVVHDSIPEKTSAFGLALKELDGCRQSVAKIAGRRKTRRAQFVNRR